MSNAVRVQIIDVLRPKTIRVPIFHQVLHSSKKNKAWETAIVIDEIDKIRLHYDQLCDAKGEKETNFPDLFSVTTVQVICELHFFFY